MRSLGKDGIAKRTHIEQSAFSIFPDKEALEKLEQAPIVPTLAADVWAKFQQLDARRGYTEAGPTRLSNEEVKAWLDLRQRSVTHWELDLIFALDDVFMSVYWENWKANNPPKS